MSRRDNKPGSAASVDSERREPVQFSVVIPTRNRSNLVLRALHSVLDQRHDDFEVLVQDDGSTDGTEKAVRQLGSPRVDYEWRPHAGRCATRNAGARRARGEFLTFLDSDDEVEPSWLAKLADAIKPRTGIVSCGMKIVVEGHAGKTVDGSIDLPRTMKAFDVNRVLLRTGTFAVRRELFLDVGGYASGLRFSENTELGFRLLPRCIEAGFGIEAVMEPLVLFHHNRARPDRTHRRARLQACEYLLDRHATVLGRDPSYEVRYRQIAAANAARLGEFSRAQEHYWRAFQAAPSLASLAPLILAYSPGLRCWYWRT